MAIFDFNSFAVMFVLCFIMMVFIFGSSFLLSEGFDILFNMGRYLYTRLSKYKKANLEEKAKSEEVQETEQ